MFDSFYLKRILTLGVLSVLFFFAGNNILPLTDPDETFYTLTAREMVDKGDWYTPYIFNKPQFEKPIFTYWLLRSAIEHWGETPFSLRFFPALFGCMGVWAVYALGLLGFRNERKAFWSAVVLCTSVLYVGMAKTIFTDMVFTVFILYALLSFFMAYVSPARKAVGLVGFYAFSGLAVLTKGPLGILIPQLAVILFLLYQKQFKFILSRWTLIGFVTFLAIALPWYLLMYGKYGQEFIQEFFVNDHWRRLIEAEHIRNDRWYFYPLTMIIGLFPWSLFLAGAFVEIYKRLKWKVEGFEYFLLSWVLVVFFIFMPAHSKLVSYILPMFPALALLTGGYIEEVISTGRAGAVRVFAYIMAGFYALLAAGVLGAYPFYKEYVSSDTPVYLCAAFLVVLSGGIVTLLLKDHLYAAMGAIGVTLLPILCTAFLIQGEINPFFSTEQASHYLPKAAWNTSKILCSKPFARGVSYHTGSQVAVMDLNGKNYFSPHPVPILTTHEELVEFFQTQPKTYAILKSSSRDYIQQKLPSDQFKVTMIASFGRSSILTVEQIPRR